MAECIECVGEITALQTDLLTGGVEMTIAVPKEHVAMARRAAQELQGKRVTCRLSHYRKKRSLEANAYVWVLCTRISDKLAISKEEVYRRNIKELSDNFYQ